MTLIKSISGIRGTIGGGVGEGVESARHREVYFGIRYPYPQNVYCKK